MTDVDETYGGAELLGMGSPPGDDEAWDDGDDTWRHPATLGLTALVLAILSLIGASVFRGAAYTLAFAPHDNGMGEVVGDSKSYVVAGAILTTAFALIPALLARAGLRRLVPSDASWAGHLLRAAFLLAVLSLVLHAVLVLVAVNSGPGLSFLSY